MRSRFLKSLLILAMIAGLLQPAAPAVAKQRGCPTPDGFLFDGKGMGGTGIHNGNGIGGTGRHDGKGMGGTGDKLANGKGMGGTGIHNGNGMGGTGSKLANGKGMGGTGITGDIGVYGRITGFGSICVNGMEIEYTAKTPVENNGRGSSTKSLRIGQIVAAKVYAKGGEYRARKIMVDKIVSGKVTKVEARRGEMSVGRERVIADGRARDIMKLVRPGEFVAVSGMRRGDGVVVAGMIERMKPAKTGAASHARELFGSGVKHFLLQGYVKEYNREAGVLRLADGTKIAMGLSGHKAPAVNTRVIVFGDVGPRGELVGEGYTAEHTAFSLGLLIPAAKGIESGGLKGTVTGAVGGLGNALGGTVAGLGGTVSGTLAGLALPTIGNDGVHVPSVDVPAVSVPTIDVPAVGVPTVDLPGLPPVTVPPIDLPPINVPTVDVPALPPIDVPLPPIIPDLPILH
ncbi:MAG TPA: DUF5666 domain-containing protein [Patescibacteria group bacterium]|nr:DUF5666 domain-containing protein [Patescibacteria group bacterium]